MILSAIIMATSCQNRIYRQDEKGVTVRVQDPAQGGPALVRLNVMGEKLIKVSATPQKRFADPESLVILPQEDVEFSVSYADDIVTVSTGSVKANVLSTTGEIWFTDKDGNMILQEQKGGGKYFEPIEVEGTSGYMFRQIF